MKYIESALLAIIAVFAPIQAALITTLFLVIIDLFMGLVVARKKKRKITSSGLKKTVGKFLMYEVAICVAFLVEQYLTGDVFPASKLVTALIGLTELKSILENLDILSEKKFFKSLIERIAQQGKQEK